MPVSWILIFGSPCALLFFRAIFNALAAGKEELVVKLMNDHVATTVDDLTGVLEQEEAVS